jgi:hypothetical protein
MFYTWTAVSNDTAQLPVASGITGPCDDAHRAQLAAAGFLLDERAFLATVAEAWPGGQVWDGRRNRGGGVTWRRRDPEPPGAPGPADRGMS